MSAQIHSTAARQSDMHEYLNHGLDDTGCSTYLLDIITEEIDCDQTNLIKEAEIIWKSFRACYVLDYTHCNGWDGFYEVLTSKTIRRHRHEWISVHELCNQSVHLSISQ
jgi:hypothetical protein